MPSIVEVMRPEPLHGPESVTSDGMARLLGERLTRLARGQDYELAAQAISLDLPAMPWPDITHAMEDEQLWGNHWVRKGTFRRVGQTVLNATRENRGITDEETGIVHHIYKKFGFTEAEAADSFAGVMTRQARPETAILKGDYVTRTLWSIDKIHEHTPYAATALYKDFGMRHFNRYQTRMLLSQVRGEAFGSTPRVALTAVGDWNGVYEEMYIKRDLHAVVGAAWRMPVLLEAMTVDEASTRLAMVADTYGPIKVLLLQAHANSEFLEFSPQPSGTLHKHELDRLFDNKILAEDCIIIITGCNAGKPDGIGQALAAKTGLRVWAPDGEQDRVRRVGLRRTILFRYINEKGPYGEGAVEFCTDAARQVVRSVSYRPCDM